MVTGASGLKVKHGNSFSNDVMADELPATYRPLKFEYDGTTNPQDYPCRFENIALLHHFSDGVKYRIFLTMLTKATQQWFVQLSFGSIGSFDDFNSLFLHQFASARDTRELFCRFSA